MCLAGTPIFAPRNYRPPFSKRWRLGIRQTEDTFVCTQADGSAFPPCTLTSAWIQTSRDLALPRIRFHDLRHSHATHLLSAGVHPKIVSERLGHSRVSITLDLYSHVLPGMQGDAVARVDDALRLALERRLSRDVG